METTVLIVTSIGIGIGFFIQTIVGFAATLFALPILLTVLSLQDSIAYLSIFHLIFSIILISKNYKYVNKKIILEVATGG
ncbi:MAG: sulfite exporter TauE/SafE family protein, partial [Nitrospirae bacterium]|nr:sulfite exporter TauE/SafE family protein [Nitrospirota bacterium]